MSLPNENQIAVTSGEFAMALFDLMRRDGKDFCIELQKQAENKWSFEQDEVVILGDQMVVAYLWMASKVLAHDKHALDLLHNVHFDAFYNQGETKEEKARLANNAQIELCERYEKYYKAWDDDAKANGGLALSMEMAQFFFPKRKPVIDFFIENTIKAGIYAFIISLSEFRKKYKITDD